MQPQGVDFRVADYGLILHDALDDNERYRALMHDLPRRFHQLPPDRQLLALSDPPLLTGTDWDAFLAAVAEHVARLHGHGIPDWAEQPVRFLDPPWVVCSCPFAARESVLFAPAAFVRHGVFPDLADLDGRGGERCTWAPSREGSGWPYPSSATGHRRTGESNGD